LSGNNWFDDVSDVERTLLIDSVPPRNARLRRAALHKQPTYWEALKAKTLSYIPFGALASLLYQNLHPGLQPRVPLYQTSAPMRQEKKFNRHWQEHLLKQL
jgi:hypothetical protein